MARAPRVRVEVLWLSVRDERVAYRVVDADLTGDAAPDDVAAKSCAGSEPAELLHSTSWRYEHQTVVLTYVALPDSRPVAARPLQPWATVVRSHDPAAPAAQAQADDVAAHACRHLSFLDRTDPGVRRVLAKHPGLRESILAWSADVAGEYEPDSSEDLAAAAV